MEFLLFVRNCRLKLRMKWRQIRDGVSLAFEVCIGSGSHANRS